MVEPMSDVLALPLMSGTAAATKAVVAICVVLVPDAAVGAAGVPVNVGLASAALAARSEAEGIPEI